MFIEGLNGSAFKLIGDSYFGGDDNNLCYNGSVIKGSDAKSLENLDCGYYKDAYNVYFNGYKLDGYDSETFELMSWGYSRDKYRVYCDRIEIVGAVPSSFEILGRKHGKDSKNIFYLQSMMVCDYESFRVSEDLDYMSADKDNKYQEGIKVLN
jgi:hypothetical protein